MTTIRYLVKDMQIAITFYTSLLDFEIAEQWGSAFASVTRKDLTLWLSGPETSAAKPMPDDSIPQPGGWNRFVLVVGNLDALVGKLREAGSEFRSDILEGPGGRQILINDPSGNPFELFEPAD